ncbi:MAG TPA: hypothetical protein VFB88_12605 [Xanthobacteraceae bacterium]|nr:hypothetical protein [Xanthobacteraceae bacterium]
MRGLRRLAIWGLSATAALAISVAAAFSDANSRRLLASAPPSNAASVVQKAAPPAAPTPDRDAESRRLSEVLGALVADREQLVARIGAIERNLEDVTGSIQRQAAAAAAAPSPPVPASPAAAPPAAPSPSKEAALTPAEPGNPARAAPPPVALSNPGGADQALAPAEPPVAPSAAESATTRTEFGVDVGGAASFDGLRVLWASTKGSNAVLLEGLHPVVARRENSRTKAVELRLIAGPLANLEAAARLCATLTAARRYCQPVAFEGQRLAHADTVPERKPAAAPRAAPAASPKSIWPLR